jgi:hypothetical protein
MDSNGDPLSSLNEVEVAQRNGDAAGRTISNLQIGASLGNGAEALHAVERPQPRVDDALDDPELAGAAASSVHLRTEPLQIPITAGESSLGLLGIGVSAAVAIAELLTVFPIPRRGLRELFSHSACGLVSLTTPMGRSRQIRSTLPLQGPPFRLLVVN